MIAAGPAMVRMLDRYRERFEHRWSEAPLGRAAMLLAVAAALLLPLAAPSESSAGDPGDAESWLLSSRNDDGGFGSERGASSSVGMTGWAILGMEAAGTNPRDVPSAGTGPIEYLRAHESEITSTADLERTILGLEAAGLDAREWEGRDLVAELRDRQNGNGSYEQQVNLTAFAILAQRAAGVDGSNVKKPTEWLLDIQNRNGGWGSVKGAESEPDSTGAVLQALAVAPMGGKKMDDAVQWIARAQHSSGGWSLTPKADPNSQSTAWAIQGIVAAGKAPGQVKTNGNSGSDFLAARQASDGHYTYSKTSDQTPVWVTAQGLMGARHVAFPIDPVKREKPEKPDTGGTNGGYDGGGYDPSTSTPTYPGSSYDPGSYDSGSFSGSNPGSSSSGGDKPSVPGTGAAEKDKPDKKGGPSKEAISEFEQAASPTAELPSQSTPLPQTFVFLAGLGALAAALGGGFLWYRRRLP
jgi:prenyltransferase beta subunit